MINIDDFIAANVTHRNKSMFINDICNMRKELSCQIEEKKMLVIGGAGSIGSSFIKAVTPFHPLSIIVVDTNENALAELTRDLHSTKGLDIPFEYIPYPMDYSSEVFRKLFVSRNGFDIIANFSAHKHVRSEKDVYSVEALLRNNIFHAKELLELLTQYPPEEYFCVSTDKATNPVNIMGASKRIMEDLAFSYSDIFPVKTARFANVAFSNGSLPAGFLTRIQKLQPLSAPADVKRYFVSPEESGQICMLACMLGKNREIFFPKLDESQMSTFDSIAIKLLNQYGYTVLQCKSDEEALEQAEKLKTGSKLYPVRFSASDTSGEKGYEEFYTQDENIDLDRFDSLGVITGKEKTDRDKLEYLLKSLNTAFEKAFVSKEEIVEIIKWYLPNFKHIETGKSLDNKM